ncbi:serine/threonine-protein kinase/endoribonucleaseIRE1, partial [Striga asiatica]
LIFLLDLPTPRPDVKHLSHALAILFGGLKANPELVGNWSQSIISRLPVFEREGFLGTAGGEPIFEKEVAHLISHLSTGFLIARPPSEQILNHPFFWSSLKRLQFLVDSFEYINRISDAVVRTSFVGDFNAIKVKARDIKDVVPADFKADLESGIEASDKKDLFIHPFVLLRAIRNSRVHAFKVKGSNAMLTKLDNDLIRGLDLMITAFWPSFFIDAYKLMCSKNTQLPASFRKYTEKGYVME